MAESVADDPKLAPLWDTPQNPEPAAKVAAHSYRPAAWRCVNGHSFARSPRAMQKDASCPTCSKGANTHTNLGKLRPGQERCVPPRGGELPIATGAMPSAEDL